MDDIPVEYFKKDKKVRNIFLVIGAVFCFILLYIIFSGGLARAFNDLFPPAKVEKLDLTTQQKLEDFEFFYKTVTESMPAMEDYRLVYGFNIEDRKEYYKRLVEKTTTDYEFYCVMGAISQEIPSFHTDIVHPESYDKQNCYNGYNVREDREVIAHNLYWSELLEKEGGKKLNKYYAFSYVDGKYLLNAALSLSDESDIPYNSQLVSVDGVDVDEFVKNQPMICNLYFDGKNNKPCRTRIVFNDTEGQMVQAELLTQSGETVVKRLCYSLYAEDRFLYYNAFDGGYENYECYEDEDYAYIAINNMSNSDGDKIKEKIKSFEQENIILDLRKNGGGKPSYAGEYIYPYIADEEWHLVANEWYMPDSDGNKVVDRKEYIFESAKDSPYKEDSNIPMLVATDSASYRGSLEEEKNVIILTSNRTGSAADRFVNDMQKLGIATIVGNNTGGEGLMGSYCAMSLPNSRLVFVYMPGSAKNPDGSDNSAIGTKADIYSALSVEDFIAYTQAVCSGEKISDYEQKLKYDTVLKTAINLFS